MDQRSVLFDPATGLHAGWYFWVRALDEVHRASRYGSPFALLILHASAGPGASHRAVEEALAAVGQAVRMSDLAAVIAPGEAAVLLPEQDAASAAAARDRIVAWLFETTSTEIDWTPRLYCHPEDAAVISQLIAHSGRSHEAATA